MNSGVKYLILRLIIFISPLIVFFGIQEIYCRKISSYINDNYFYTHDRLSYLKYRVTNSDIIILGNSISRGGINPSIVEQHINNTVFNLSSLGYVGSGHVLTQFDILDSWGTLKNKTFIINLDARQWLSIKDNIEVVKKNIDDQRKFQINDILHCFYDYNRIKLTKIIENMVYFYISDDYTFINAVYNINPNLAGYGDSLIFHNASGWCESKEQKRYGIITHNEYRKFIRPAILNKYLVKKPDYNERNVLEQNLIILSKKIAEYRKNNNKFILLRCPQDKILIDFENRNFTEIQKYIITSKLPFIDLTNLGGIYLEDGGHPNSKAASAISHEFSFKLKTIIDSLYFN